MSAGESPDRAARGPLPADAETLPSPGPVPPRHATPAIEVRGLTHTYADGTAALRGVDLVVHEGDAVGLIGANGAGKSTLLRHLNGLLRPSSGSVTVGGVPVRPAHRAEVLRRVGFVFQDPDDQLFMPTVAEDVAFGPVQLGWPDGQVQARVQQALQAVGATHLAPRAPYRLSGGEKRMVALAGVLAMDPALLVLDEPSAALDPAARRRLIGVLQRLPQTRVIASHDLDLVLECCTRVLLMHEGRLQADGAPADVFRDGALLARCGLEPPLAWGGGAAVSASTG